MPPKSRETPRERYASNPLTEDEKRDLPIKFQQALAMGEPFVVAGARGDTLVFELCASTIRDDETIELAVRFTGDVIRPDRIATATGVTQTIAIPAKVKARSP